MKEKLTLSIDKKTIKKAKRFARQQGTNISQMVEMYLDSISRESPDPIQQLGRNPVDTGVEAGSEKHNRYIYTTKK